MQKHFEDIFEASVDAIGYAASDEPVRLPEAPSVAQPMMPPEDIGRLAELYDRANHAFDPFAPEGEATTAAFERRVEELHASRGPSVRFADFCYELVKLCREYLRRNHP